ncbi:MAG: four helix bundle protein [Alphaproteobacteria bacterium]|nr:four helix bundle protein [Alphaproteobacteria bacterium]
MAESLILSRSEDFALRVIKLYKFLQNKNEFIISKQIFRSGTSIGANAAEAVHASSNKDFVCKLEISQRECSETLYWLRLLEKSGFITKKQFENIYTDCIEIEKILTTIIKKTKKKL